MAAKRKKKVDWKSLERPVDARKVVREVSTILSRAVRQVRSLVK